MADYAISNVPRRVVFAPSGVGPYAFTFEILTASDIAVYKGTTLLTLTTDYTVTINANGTGSVTLVASAGTSNITIVGAKTIQRTADFVTGGDFFANTLNDELDAQTIFSQQVAETVDRSLKAPVTDPTNINMTLPTSTSRANKYLSFDANGNPSVSEAFTDAYIGGAAVNPTADSSGNPLTIGDLYFNTAVNEMRVYTSTGWTALTDFGGTVSTLNVTGTATLPTIAGPTTISSATLPSASLSNATLSDPTITGTATVAALTSSGTLTANGILTANNGVNLGLNTTLSVAITSTSSTADITVASTTGFPSSGSIQIDSEIISYTNKTATTFTGIARAQSGTAGATHVLGTRVHTVGVKIKGSIDDPVAINVNSTETALRLTQIGTGDVLRVEDAASPDSSRLTISNAGALTLGNSTTFNGSLIISSSASITWGTYGSISYDSGSRFFSLTHDSANEGSAYPILQRHQRLSVDSAAIGPAIADFFSSAPGLAIDSWYEFEYVLYFTKTTAGTVTFTIATDNAPQLLSAEYIGSPVGGVGAVGAAQTAAIIKSTSFTAALPATGSLTTAVNHTYRIKGIVRSHASLSSFLRLRITSGAGTVTPLAGSYQKINRISYSDTIGSFG